MRRKLFGAYWVWCVFFSGLCLPLIFAQGVTAKKAVMIIAQENFQDDEFLQPKEVLEKSGIAVTVASTTLSVAKGMNGAMVKPDILIDDIKVDDYDTVIFVGGSGAVQYLDDPRAHAVALEALTKGKIIGAICIAPRILTNAGILKGRNATVYPTEGQKLSLAGVNYTGKPVERDGTIITADGPGSARAFGQEIRRALEE
jgi:protease I